MSEVEGFRPLEDDPSKREIQSLLDLTEGERWVMTAPGDYAAATVEGFKKDGSSHQYLIALTWPGRYNHSDEEVTVQLMMHPEDAAGLAEVLAHSVSWFREYMQRN